MDVFVARQPIFNAARAVVAYEILFRDGLDNAFPARDGTQASRQVLWNTFVLFGQQQLTGGLPAFVNVTREALLMDLVTLFPPHAVVVEILEDIAPDDEVVARCERLKAEGYTLALDDFTQIDDNERLLELVDVVKVDFRATLREHRKLLARRLQRWPLVLLGEKVETTREMDEALELGFALFQGFHLAHPEVLERRDVPGLWAWLAAA